MMITIIKMCLQADTDLAMVMLESSSSASEAASRLDSLRIAAEASKQASLHYQYALLCMMQLKCCAS